MVGEVRISGGQDPAILWHCMSFFSFSPFVHLFWVHLGFHGFISDGLHSLSSWPLAFVIYIYFSSASFSSYRLDTYLGSDGVLILD